jgi:hypothetical protein
MTAGAFTFVRALEILKPAARRKHPGTFTLSIHEAHVLARLKNEAQYRGTLK